MMRRIVKFAETAHKRNPKKSRGGFKAERGERGEGIGNLQ